MKITAAGCDTCVPIKYQIRNDLNPEIFGTCQTNTPSNDSRKRAENIDGGIQPLGQCIIGTTRLIEPGDLLVKYVEDGIRRTTVLKFVEQRMGAEIFLGLLLVSLDGIVEDGLIVRGVAANEVVKVCVSGNECEDE